MSAEIPEILQRAARSLEEQRLGDTEPLLRQVLDREPTNAPALFLLGTLHCYLGQWARAVDALKLATTAQPDNADAWNNLGTALRNLSRPADASQAYRQSHQVRESSLAHENLASLLLGMGAHRDAAAHARRAIELDPTRAQTHCDLALSLLELARPGDALSPAGRAVALDPRSIAARNTLSVVLHACGDAHAAEREARAGIQLAPATPQLWLALGQALSKQRRLDEAADAFTRATELQPDTAPASVGLALVRHEQARLEEAVAAATLAVQTDPSNTRAFNALGNSLRQQGRLPEALDAYRQAIRVVPENLVAHDNLCYSLHFSESHSPEQILEEHLKWSDRHELPLVPRLIDYRNDRHPDRRLRIGLVSPDLRDHAVGRMLLPVLKARDPAQIEVICYAGPAKADGMTAQFKASADGWVETSALTDERFAARVRDDRIDILLDLSLHMSNNRLQVFARRPAPVQATHMGYPATTGMRSIQYRITDRHIDPPGETEAVNTEQLVRLPHSFWCYLFEEDAPPCGEVPALARGHITFGSLNNPAKISPGTAALWTRIVLAVPGSKLMLLVYDHSGESGYLRRLFEERGLPAQRLIFVRQRPRNDYLLLYRDIDIVLDPMPYNGHNTSIDAMLMGVPVITLPGRTSVSRAGVSLARNMALDDLIAAGEQHLMQMARELSGDLPRLRTLRAELRERLRRSPLCDGRTHAAALQDAFRWMWRRWCES